MDMRQPTSHIGYPGTDTKRARHDPFQLDRGHGVGTDPVGVA